MNCQTLYLKTNSTTLVFYDPLIQKPNCGITVVFKGYLPFFPELMGEIKNLKNNLFFLELLGEISETEEIKMIANFSYYFHRNSK